MIVIVDYGIGNVGSLCNMMRKLGIPSQVGRTEAELRQATKLVLPGVGAFDNGIASLQARGLVPVLNELVQGEGRPILGICLGMQLFATGSQEGRVPGLGWIDADVVRFSFAPGDTKHKIPHMGWNTVQVTDPERGVIPPDSRFYFVHGYHLQCRDEGDVAGHTDYGYRFHCAVRRKNVYGVQFHPEKSHRFGMALFQRFWNDAS